jgi:DNA-binding NarL/FixJ family response regulator
MPNPKRRILIVDDHPLYRDGLRRFIDSEPDLVCCGEAESSQPGLQAACQLNPDLVIVDLRLQREDGLELLKNLQVRLPTVRTLVLSQKDESVYAQPALRAGAAGYIMKEEATKELLQAIRAVLRGQIYLSSRLSVLVLNKLLSGQSGDLITDKLSDRELQVFQFLGSGLSTQETAEQLHLSGKTVETYRENIKRKLGLPDAQSLVKAARNWVRTTEG